MIGHLAAGQQNPLVPDVSELVVGLVVFIIVFAILAKVLMPRITKTLEERTDKIEGGLNRAEEAQKEANRVLNEYKAQLAEARHEASRLREEAKEQGAAIAAELRAKGEAERQRIVAAAQAQIEAEHQQAISALRAEVGSLAVELAGRIVGESLEDEARQRGTVDRFLAELEQRSGDAAEAAEADDAAGARASS